MSVRWWAILPTTVALSMSAQTPVASMGTPTEFEVASIRPSASSIDVPVIRPMLNGIRATGCTLQILIVFAYGHYGAGKDVFGLPKWAESDRFDVLTKVSAVDADELLKLNANQREAALQRMFRSLLADRFKLQAHPEFREAPALALIVAKGGAKVKQGKSDDPALPNGALRVTNSTITGTGVTMARLATSLSSKVGQSVVDKTSLVGSYTFALTWGPSSTSQPTQALPDSVDSSFYSALQEQLGLKLASTSVKLEVIIVDHAEKPSAN